MSILLSEPGVDGLNRAVAELREWQFDGAPMQLHPGDLGWNGQFGTEALCKFNRRKQHLLVELILSTH
jgi:hypothetical protein